MRSFVFRIRKRYFDAIVSGDKTTEFRPDTPFWRSRIDGKGDEEPWVAVFICGRRVHRRQITLIQKVTTPNWFSEQGKRDVSTPLCYAIHLGLEVSGGSASEKLKKVSPELRYPHRLEKATEPNCKVASSREAVGTPSGEPAQNQYYAEDSDDDAHYFSFIGVIPKGERMSGGRTGDY